MHQVGYDVTQQDICHVQNFRLLYVHVKPFDLKAVQYVETYSLLKIERFVIVCSINVCKLNESILICSNAVYSP